MGYSETNLLSVAFLSVWQIVNCRTAKNLASRIDDVGLMARQGQSDLPPRIGAIGESLHGVFSGLAISLESTGNTIAESSKDIGNKLGAIDKAVVSAAGSINEVVAAGLESIVASLKVFASALQKPISLFSRFPH